uniref:Uncharacterized protein n=1 Tax=Streptomyces sp. NBC_00003 TaxID=2903608 RepID=A0AAU2V837_9ACTN
MRISMETVQQLAAEMELDQEPDASPAPEGWASAQLLALAGADVDTEALFMGSTCVKAKHCL